MTYTIVISRFSSCLPELTEHANILLSTCAVIAFSHFLCSLFFRAQGASNFSQLQPSDRSAILEKFNFSRITPGIYSLQIANKLKIFNQSASTRCSVITKKNCLPVFSASLGVISDTTGNLLLSWAKYEVCLFTRLQTN